jgi:hypothetical protein
VLVTRCAELPDFQPFIKDSMSEDTSVVNLELPITSPSEPPRQQVASKSWQRGFWSLVVTQFQGAFNDNAYKNLIVFIILGTAIEKANRDRLVLVAGALFSVPFILFSMTGGFLADRYSKRTVTIGTKVFEIAVMVLAIAGLAWQNLQLEMAAIFLASTQAAFFGPSKYGLLPELLPEQRLSWGNGVIELGTDRWTRFRCVPGRCFPYAPRLVGPDLPGTVYSRPDL